MTPASAGLEVTVVTGSRLDVVFSKARRVGDVFALLLLRDHLAGRCGARRRADLSTAIVWSSADRVDAGQWRRILTLLAGAGWLTAGAGRQLARSR